MAPEEYKLGSLRYDLWKLRAKGLVEKIPHFRLSAPPRWLSNLLGISQVVRQATLPSFGRTDDLVEAVGLKAA